MREREGGYRYRHTLEIFNVFKFLFKLPHENDIQNY